MSRKEEFNVYKVIGSKLRESFNEEQLSVLDHRLHNCVWTDPPSKQFNDAIKDETDGDYKLMHLMIRDIDGNESITLDEFMNLGTLQTSVLRSFLAKITSALYKVLTDGKEFKEEVDSEEGKPIS